MTDKEEIKFAIRYLKKGLKSKRTPPLYEELMNELGFVKEVKSESCCQRCALPKDLVGSAWCTQHCQHDNRFKRNKEFAELNDKLNNFASVAEAEDFFKENFPEYVTEKGECLSPYWDLFSAGVICATFELNNKIAELKAYNEKLLDGDIEKHNKIVELKKKYEKMCTIAHNRGSFVISAMRENRIFEEQLTKAKEIIKRLLKATYGEGWNYSLQVKVEAEKFLKEEYK